MLWRVKIQLVAPEDDDSDMSEMDISNASIPPDHSEADPLAVDHGGPEQEEGEISEQSSSPDDVLGCDTYLDGGLASDTGTAPERIDGFQSEEMDTTAQPLGAESYSDRPMGSQDAQYDRSLPAWQLKAWEAFQTLNIGRRKKPPMPTGDVTPPGCPRAKLHSKAPETLSRHPVVAARSAETTCRSQASSSQTASADKKLMQKPVVDLSRMGEEDIEKYLLQG